MSDEFFIGVDGGGTKTHVRIRDPRGTVIGEAYAGSGNVHTDLEGAVQRIVGAVADVLDRSGKSARDTARAHIGLGLAGLVTQGDPARIAKEFPGFASVKVASDAATACIGAHAGRDGGVIISGTGSAGHTILRGKSYAIGGRGFELGDDGSGARIGWDAMRHTLNAADDLGPRSVLTDKLIKRFNDDPIAVTSWSATAMPADYGALAPIVLGYAEKGDPVALPIVKHHARAIVALARKLQSFGAERLCLVGGLGSALLPWVELEQAGLFQPTLHDPADGAILMIGGVVA